MTCANRLQAYQSALGAALEHPTPEARLMSVAQITDDMARSDFDLLVEISRELEASRWMGVVTARLLDDLAHSLNAGASDPQRDPVQFAREWLAALRGVHGPGQSSAQDRVRCRTALATLRTYAVRMRPAETVA